MAFLAPKYVLTSNHMATCLKKRLTLNDGITAYQRRDSNCQGAFVASCDASHRLQDYSAVAAGCWSHMTPLIAGKFSSTAFAVCCTAGVLDDANLRMICGSLTDAAKCAEAGGGQPSANSLLSLIATGPATNSASL